MENFAAVTMGMVIGIMVVGFWRVIDILYEIKDAIEKINGKNTNKVTQD